MPRNRYRLLKDTTSTTFSDPGNGTAPLPLPPLCRFHEFRRFRSSFDTLRTNGGNLTNRCYLMAIFRPAFARLNAGTSFSMSVA